MESWKRFIKEEKDKFLYCKELKFTEEWENFLRKEETFFLADESAYERLSYLEHLFSLDEFEQCYLHFLLLPEICTTFQLFYHWLEPKNFTISFSMVCRIYHAFSGNFAGYAWLSQKRTLIRFFLEEEGGNWRLKKRILDFLLKGEWENSLFFNDIFFCYPEEELLPYYGENILETEKESMEEKKGIFCLYGREGTGKKSAVRHYEKKQKHILAILYLKNRIEEEIPIDQELLFELILHQAVVCIADYKEQWKENGFFLRLVEQILELSDYLYLLLDQEDYPKLPELWIKKQIFFFDFPSIKEAEIIWNAVIREYGLENSEEVEKITKRFLFTPKQIRQAVIWASEQPQKKDNLLKGCFLQLEHNLGKKAKKVECFYEWEDLILPKQQIHRLKDACNQVKYQHQIYETWGFYQKISYGRGVSMLFYGVPGTGKTMASEIIAKEIGLELYKVNLPCIVSKYIGETEKNLNEIFEEAEKSQGILFFDEADVLFSKRTEVKEANDKYNNLEAAYLLQKMEEHRGVVILATNYQQNIDEAFKRRIKFCIEFPLPDAEYRKKIWEAGFPKELPCEKDIDLEFLSMRFRLSGSNIKNSILNAAFYAASEGSGVGMRHLLKAVVNELSKSGKVVTKEELGEYYYYMEELYF